MENKFENAMSKRTNEELTKIINSSSDYQAEAIQAAEQEIQKRQSIVDEQSTYSDEQLLEILTSKNNYKEYEIQNAEIEVEKRKKMELLKDEENKKTEIDSKEKMNEDKDSYPFNPQAENKCIVCEEDASRTDLYFIWHNGDFKGVSEISICKECIKPYLPRKTGKLIGAIFICILLLVFIILLLSVETDGFDFNWWQLIVLFGAAYQAYQWFSDYSSSGDVTNIDDAVLQTKMADILGKTKLIKGSVIINWEALKEKQQSMKVAVTDFTNPDFLASVRTPISLGTSGGTSRIELELIPETSEINYLPKYFNDEDKELLKESINQLRQEKENAHKANLNALQEKYLNKSN